MVKAAPRSVRNHNPGNIEFNRNNDWRGQLDDRTDTRFAEFETPAHGFRALGILLTNYHRQGFQSVEEILHRYAPPHENSTDAYITRVANQIGVSQHDQLDIRDPATLYELMVAVTEHETGGRFDDNWSRADLVAGIKMAIEDRGMDSSPLRNNPHFQHAAYRPEEDDQRRSDMIHRASLNQNDETVPPAPAAPTAKEEPWYATFENVGVQSFIYSILNTIVSIWDEEGIAMSSAVAKAHMDDTLKTHDTDGDGLLSTVEIEAGKANELDVAELGKALKASGIAEANVDDDANSLSSQELALMSKQYHKATGRSGNDGHGVGV